MMISPRFFASLPSFTSVCAFTYIHLSIFLYSFPVATSFPQFAPYFPNAKNIVINNVKVRGLGHASFAALTTNENIANPFGKRVFGLDANGGLATAWVDTMCLEDSDNDGITNGVELCDPGCDFVPNSGINPSCGAGVELTHPGFAPGVGEELPTYVKFHAALMIIAWIFLAPVGIITALLFKKNTTGSVLWFKVHRSCLYSVSFLTILAFFVMVFKTGFALSSQHPKLGICVVLLAVVQPLSGYFRPHNPKNSVYVAKTNTRLLWEFQHQNTGRLAVVLSVCAVVTGLEAGFGETEAVEAGTKALAVILGLVAVTATAFVFLVRENGAPEKVLEKDFEQRRSILDSGEMMKEAKIDGTAGGKNDGTTGKNGQRMYVPSLKVQSVSEKALEQKVLQENKGGEQAENPGKKQSVENENPRFNQSFGSNKSKRSVKNAVLAEKAQNTVKNVERVSEKAAQVQQQSPKKNVREIPVAQVVEVDEENNFENPVEDEEQVYENDKLEAGRDTADENEEEEEADEGEDNEEQAQPTTSPKKRDFNDFDV